MELPHQIRQAIEMNFPAHLKNCTHWEGRIQKAFMSQNINGDWGSFIAHIDDHTVMYLGLTAELLQTKANTKSIADAEIQEVRERIAQIYNEVRNSELSIDIKIYLVRYLQKIITSIDEYYLTGAIPVLESVGALLGHAFVDKKYCDFLRNEELGERIFECLTAMANVVTVAVGLPQLTQAIALLPT